MSTTDNTTRQDKPEYIQGDVIEAFNPESKAYKWIEIEDVIDVHSMQILAFRGYYFCACSVRVESIGGPGMVESLDERKKVD
jgi:hypothetical protein